MIRKRSHFTSFLIKRCLILITRFIKFGNCEKVTALRFILCAKSHFVRSIHTVHIAFLFFICWCCDLYLIFSFFSLKISTKSNFFLFIVIFLEATQTASWIINRWARVHPVLHNSIIKPPPHQRHRLVALVLAVIHH